MIQRLQSIFLLLTSASFWALFGLPFASSDQATAQFLADKVYGINDHIVLLILAILGGVIALGAIFLYKNRQLQIKMSYLTLILSIILPVVVILLFYNEATENTMDVKIDDQLGIYLPALGIIFSILAMRFIKKDEKTVRSMDRLR